MIAGKDDLGGGSWLGLHRNGRFACLTNFRDARPPSPTAPSRGELVVDYLNHATDSDEFSARLQARLMHFNGFNMVFGSTTELRHISNRTRPQQQRLENGLHGISNGALNEAWPKVAQGRERLAQILQSVDQEEPIVERTLELLQDRTVAPDAALPDTGVGLDRERILSPIFIAAGEYGTRCSTVILVRSDGQVCFAERSFDSQGVVSANVLRRFALQDQSSP